MIHCEIHGGNNVNIFRRSPVNLPESSPLNGRKQIFSAASSDGGPVQRKIVKVILGGVCARSIHWELAMIGSVV